MNQHTKDLWDLAYNYLHVFHTYLNKAICSLLSIQSFVSSASYSPLWSFIRPNKYCYHLPSFSFPHLISSPNTISECLWSFWLNISEKFVALIKKHSSDNLLYSQHVCDSVSLPDLNMPVKRQQMAQLWPLLLMIIRMDV